MKIQWQKPRKAGTTGGIVDPYYEWTAATKYAYYGKAKWLPLLIELEGITASEFAAHELAIKLRSENLLRISPFFSNPRGLPRLLEFCTAFAQKDFFKVLAREAALRGMIKRFELSRRIAFSVKGGGNLTSAKKLKGGGKGGGKTSANPRLVVIGIIDDGLAFAHHRFRIGKQTRVEYMWDQLEPSSLPPGWDYGREIRKTIASGTIPPIDTLLANCEHVGLVDEDELYRSFHVNYTEPGHKAAAWRVSHGTLAMDLACGDDPAIAHNDRPIVCVQLPTATTADTSGGTLSHQVIDALLYIIDRANAIAADRKCAPPPIVVNLSYGIFAGPHDGSGDLEAEVDRLIRAREADDKAPMRVVLPSGNSHLSRCHACFCIDDGQVKELHWRVQPDDRTESLLDIWLPPVSAGPAQPNVSVEVIAPSGDTSGEIGQGLVGEVRYGANVVGQVANYRPDQTANNRGRIYIALGATASDEGTVSVAPCGLWRVRLKNNGANTVHDIHAWIQRDDNPYGYPRRGRQSRFDDPDYMRFNVYGREIERDEDDAAEAYVKRDGAISAIATGNRTIVIGGFRRSDGHPLKYSAGGPLLFPGRGAPNANGPDAMAVSEDSVACHGVLGAGSRSGSRVAMFGTSVAAPIVTRWVADELAAGLLAPGHLGDRPEVYDLAQTQEGGPRRWPELAPQAKRGGGGRILFPPGVPVPRNRRIGE